LKAVGKQKQHLAVLTLVGVIALLPSMYYAYMQIEENKIVDHYLSQNKLGGLPVSKETAIRVSDQVRDDFNVNESSFTALNLAERPFLRKDVGFLLTHKEGLCGEGTRVIVNLLSRLGFNASRITLFNRELQSAHTLVSVVIDEQEFFLDSINSTEEVNELLRNNNISSNDFNLMHYSDNISTRREFARTGQSRIDQEGLIKFFDRYWLYSYEATPYSKILTKIGFDVRVFNFKRPNQWISVLSEKPNKIMFLFTLIVSVLTLYLLHKLKIVRKILLMKPMKK
jgi:hypothetical protein